jgi:glycerol-3-phosphate acyltransferase PlsX
MAIKNENQVSRPIARHHKVVALDAMSGDDGPSAALDAAEAVLTGQQANFVIFGDRVVIETLLATRPTLAANSEIVDCDSVVAMSDRPRDALRHGRGSSMSKAIEAQTKGLADVVVSAGNTGALMAMATLQLKRAPGVARPAIAALWPSLSSVGACVALDMGGDVRADAKALTTYAILGSEYARAALGIATPRIAILNVGSESNKGRPEIKKAAEMLQNLEQERRLGGRFVGYIEGDQIAFDKADVVVTDGFSGNIALKSAEGAARLVSTFMREAFRASIWSKVAAYFAAPSFRRLKRRMDPRSVNGGVFLGLRGLIVKSHGSADAIAFASAIRLALRLTDARVYQKLEERLAQIEKDDRDRDDVAETPAADRKM